MGLLVNGQGKLVPGQSARAQGTFGPLEEDGSAKDHGKAREEGAHVPE